MNSLRVGLFTVLTVFTGTVFSIASQDQFKKLFDARVPIPQMLTAVFDNDQAAQLEHFQTIQQHIDKGDEYASYANSLKKTVQKVLDSKLNEAGYKSIDIAEYMKAENDIASGIPLKDKEMESAVKEMMESRNRLMQSSEEEKKRSLDRLVEAATASAIEEALSHESVQFQKSRGGGQA